ncbi:Metallo-dependent phosphatase-like protein [Infundibulicybe gibba]|nr:Metallo-dependent phosphatase-like protein [Infundibulicybe gibba]
MPRIRTFLLVSLLPVLALYAIYNPEINQHLPTPAQISQIFSNVPSLLSAIPALLRASPDANIELRPPRPKPFVRHIVAVGDLHGDMPNARRVLQFAGVTDDFGNWAGGVDYFVQTGDIIDRGDDTIKLFAWMDQLRAQAHAWVVLYVYPTELKTFGSVAGRQAMLSIGSIGRSWAANYTTASRLPLHPSLGPPNTPYPPISLHISDSLLAKIQRRTPPPPHPPHPYPGLPIDATKQEAALYDANGPLWYRGWALDSEEKACADVEKVLKKTGTRRMIMGHTPDFKNIVSRCDGKIIIIDTGISHAYGGVLSALSIHYTLTPIGTDGTCKHGKRRK